MKLLTFRGGVHPDDCKGRTRDAAIKGAALPGRVLIPLEQNTGSPPRVVVKPGQYVRTGETIAEPSAAISVPLHASISGTVAAIRTIPVPYGGTGEAVEIEGDGKDARAWGGGVADPLRMNGSEIIRAVRDAGIVGLGGAEFPTHVKLLPPPGKTLDCLIINGVECEPYLTADHRLMLERTGDLLGGIRLFMRAAGVGCALVGIEENKRDACDALRRMIGEAGDVVPVLLEVKYPQGAEKQLIKALTGREVPRRGLPADVGVIVQNVGTAVAAWEACRLGKPLYERVVTVSGPAVREAGNLMVRIGTLFKEVIAQCGGLTGDAGLLIMGGPMMGVAQWSMDVPVVKGTSGIVAMPAGMARKGEEACIRCGRCLEVCPMGLSPALIRQAVEKGRWDLAAEHGVEECIECGACVYVCATDRNQIQLYKRAKLEIRKGKTDAGRAA